MNETTTAQAPVTVDPKKNKWIGEVLGSVVLSQDNQKALNDRKNGEAVINSLNASKEDIRKTLLSVEVTVKSGLKSKKMKLLDEDGNYRNEIDTRHHAGNGMQGMSIEQVAEVGKAMENIHAAEAQLKNNPYYSAGEPDFTPLPDVDFEGMSDDERDAALEALDIALAQRAEEEAAYEKLRLECEAHLAEDLWQPLVREGVIPENFVPTKYSAVAQLFEASSGAYEDRLQEYSANLSDNDILLQKFELGYKIGNGVVKLAGATSGLAGSVGDLTGDDGVVATAEEVGTFIGHLSTALTISEGLTKAALTDKDFSSVGQAIADAIGAAIEKEYDTQAGKIVASVIANASRAVNIGSALKEGDYEKAFTELLEGIGSELERFDPDEDGGLMSEIGGQIVSKGKIAISALKLGKRAAEGASPLELQGLLMDTANLLAKEVTNSLKTDKEKAKEKAEEEAAEPSSGGEAFEASIAESFEEEDDSDPAAARAAAIAVLTDQFDQDKLDARRKEADIAAAQKALASAEEKMAAEQEAFEHHMRMGFPMVMDDDDAIEVAELERVASIEYLLAVQKKNEATFNMCTTIASKGIAFVTKLFPPAALAEACMTLALTIKDAIEKAEELIIWRENVEDAMSAASAQADAMLNRRGLQTKQVVQANIQVALDAAKVVSEVLSMTPIAAAAPVIKSSVAVAEAAIELADLIYTEAQMAKAWKIYVTARDDPEDRYLARKASRENPTLAKYAMAYGSLNGDPIAMEGMRRCGLNKQTLSNPGTNVEKVVSYLESRYPDDPVLLRAVPVPDKWYPGPIALSSKSWISFYKMATTDASPTLSTSQDTSGIAAALAKLEDAEDAFDKAIDATIEEAKEITKAEAEAAAKKNVIDGQPLVAPVSLDKAARVGLVSALLRAQDQLRKFKALDEANVEHKEMAKYVEALAAKCELRRQSVAKIVKSAPWTAYYKAA